MTLVLVLVMAKLCVPQVEEGTIEIHRGTGSGIYYEPIYKMRIFSNTFNLIIHVNISGFIDKYNELNNLANYNDKLSLYDNNNISTIYKNFKTTLMVTKAELLKRYTTLISLHNGIRTKRGLINAIGEFENWAFGVVGDSDYQHIQ